MTEYTAEIKLHATVEIEAEGVERAQEIVNDWLEKALEQFGLPDVAYLDHRYDGINKGESIYIPEVRLYRQSPVQGGEE